MIAAASAGQQLCMKAVLAADGMTPPLLHHRTTSNLEILAVIPPAQATPPPAKAAPATPGTIASFSILIYSYLQDERDSLKFGKNPVIPEEEKLYFSFARKFSFLNPLIFVSC
jgi:hypothetical protein